MEKIKEFFKKVSEWFKKFWLVVFIPIGFFLVSMLTMGNRKERLNGVADQLKDDIKDTKKDIKEAEKEAKKAEKKLTKKEKEFTQATEEMSNAVKEAEKTIYGNEAIVSELEDNVKDREKRGGKFVR